MEQIQNLSGTGRPKAAPQLPDGEAQINLISKTSHTWKIDTSSASHQASVRMHCLAATELHFQSAQASSISQQHLGSNWVAPPICISDSQCIQGYLVIALEGACWSIIPLWPCHGALVPYNNAMAVQAGGCAIIGMYTFLFSICQWH